MDKNCDAYLLEMNSNPSLNMFQEIELANGEIDRKLSPIDQYVKVKLIEDVIKLIKLNPKVNFHYDFIRN